MDLRTLPDSSPLLLWAHAQDAELCQTPSAPVGWRAERNPDGRGHEEYTLYSMPPRNPWDCWADITSDTDSPPVDCPVPGCTGYLQWWEAGYVPGYRVCMQPRAGGYDRDTLRHRFCLDTISQADAGGTMTLLLLGDDTEEGESG